jgi:hypothetical protein
MKIYQRRNPAESVPMMKIYGLVLYGALFKKKKEPAGTSEERAKDRETEIRRKVVDDLRDREDALMKREAAIIAREEELERGRAELARRLQELAASASASRNAPQGAPAGAVPAPAAGQARSAREIEKHMKKLEEELEKVRAVHHELTAQERKKGEYLEKLISYKSNGYSVARLEAVMGKSPEEIDRAFRAYQKDIDRLVALAARCDGVDPVFAREAQALKALCTRPEAIGDIEKGLKDLETKERAKKKLLMDRVGKWNADGFVVSRFERLEEASLGDLEETVLQFDENLGALRKLGERLNALGESFAKDSAPLRPWLNDPDRIQDLEKAISRLEKSPAGSGPVPAEQNAGAANDAAAPASPPDKDEETVKSLIAETEKFIKELNTAGTDPTAAENLLRMARSFTRSKNFAKALEYAKKAHMTAIELKT